MNAAGRALLKRPIAINKKLNHAALRTGTGHQEAMSADDLPRYYSLSSVSKATDYSIRTLRAFIAKGELKAERWGRDYRITEEELGRFIESRRQAAIPERQRPGSKPGPRDE
jgi:excisionase family DNA binding protein